MRRQPRAAPAQARHALRARLVAAVALTGTLGLAVPPLLATDPTLAPDRTLSEPDDRSSEPGFAVAAPGYAYRFPRDHGAHEAFRTEWWYYTGHVAAADGRRFGYELTFFRRGVEPDPLPPGRSRWTVRHLYLAHVAVSDLTAGRFAYAEKLSRAGLGKAGAETGRLHVWIDRWSAAADPSRPHAFRLRASAERFAIDLELRAEKPPVVHGDDGVSRKGAGRAETSHYYSLTRLRTEGTLRIGDTPIPVTGLSWMDHEFGSADLGAGLVGWDWFSLQLDDGTDLMFYLLRRADGSPDPASSGTVVAPDGTARPLALRDVSIEVLDHWRSPASGARYPSAWRLAIPRGALSVSITPLLADQELRTDRSTRVTYWEGAVAITGTHDGAPVSGQGYVELTGYADPFTRAL